MTGAGYGFTLAVDAGAGIRRNWPTREKARTAIYDYIEGWYNPRWRHSALGYLSPVQYEQLHHRDHHVAA